jgi:hypothetical protein
VYLRRHVSASYRLELACGNALCADEPEPQMCGSRGLEPCADGFFCDFAVEAMCGAADRPGVCEPIPDLCTREFRPVCGCDGETYSNRCTAAASGSGVLHDGNCRRPGGGVGATCGGIAALRCAEGLDCDMSGVEMCHPDMAGICVEPLVRACVQIYDPVCGCDGHTYGNDGMRRGARTARAHEGECE